MKRRSHVLEIARWEFLRYFKVRDLVITALLVAGMGGASWLLSWWQARSSPPANVAAISPVPVASADPALRLEPHQPGELDALRARVQAGDLDGVLVIEPPAARLIARDEPRWLGAASAAAGQALQSVRLARSGITPAQLAEIVAPVALELDLLRGEARSGSSRVTALIIVGLMLAAVAFGVSYLFMAITGEKQQRVTEQVFVMTSAQSLIDGKLIGHGLLTILVVAQTTVVSALAYEFFAGGLLDWLAPTVREVGAAQLAVLLAYGVAGFAFWFTLLAALFATIDDPHSSARTNAIMLPFLPLSAVFFGLSNPDSPMMQVLALFPLTAMTVMPARIVLGMPSAIEIAISLALLVAATWWLRRAAARVYQGAMLMYGNEPSLRDMLRWLR
jgi:ABC-2 type transport system permease protein